MLLNMEAGRQKAKKDELEDQEAAMEEKEDRL